MASDQRPLGVTIIGIVGILVGCLALLLGLAATVFGTAFVYSSTGGIGEILSVFGGLIGIVGVVIVLAAVAELIVCWGLLSRKYWAWLVALILEALGVIGSLGTLMGNLAAALPGLAIGAVVIWYLLQPHVRAWFERKQAPAVAYPPPPPSYA
jgi:hypothetical protein